LELSETFVAAPLIAWTNIDVQNARSKPALTARDGMVALEGRSLLR
jgi:hypothetical protein